MSDAPARPLDETPSGRVLDAQTSFGRARDDRRLFYGLVAQSPAMQALVRLVERLAPHARSTLITGSNGAGKSTLAAVVHRLGPCRGGAQVTLLGGDEPEDAAAVADAVRGARTPVTCFVPEIRDLSTGQQAALVRALIRAADLPPGEGLHVIAGTSAAPAEAVARREVRADLVSRVSAVRYHVPPLGDRRPDIPALATTLLREACRRQGLADRAWSSAAQELLEALRWPGHVRQLRDVAWRAAALSDDTVIAAHTLREAYGSDVAWPSEMDRSGECEEGERSRVMAALAAADGNKSAAAISLGVSRRAFYRMLERLGA